jgi:hypothetical protein
LFFFLVICELQYSTANDHPWSITWTVYIIVYLRCLYTLNTASNCIIYYNPYKMIRLNVPLVPDENILNNLFDKNIYTVNDFLQKKTSNLQSVCNLQCKVIYRYIINLKKYQLYHYLICILWTMQTIVYPLICIFVDSPYWLVLI